jgi:glycosyltransferase involved in cell wall biosynthesis
VLGTFSLRFWNLSRDNTKMTTPKLHACMMMRNDEHQVHRCLSSIRDLCDEIVIVDTGSTDRTMEIAIKEYGAIVYPSTMSWRVSPRFDFSYHRNESIQLCEELGADWLYIIDSDEELADLGIPPEEFKKRLNYVQDDVHALGCKLHEKRLEDGEFLLSFWGTRFFKAGLGVHYMGICHNRPKLINGYAAATNIVMYHYGYQNENVMDGKRSRTLMLLDKRIKEDPETDYPAYYYKCMTLCGMGRVDEAIEAGNKCFELIKPVIDDDPERLNFYGALYYALGWAYFNKWEHLKDQKFATLAYQWWHKGHDIWPDDIDLNYYLTVIGFLGSNVDMVKEHGDRYLASIGKYKDEINISLDGFYNSCDFGELAIGPRHIHQAQKIHQDSIVKMMKTMGVMVS